MSNYPKYRYPEPIPIKNRQWPDRIITAPPIWASVDLRDGNQALPEPMSPEHKLEYFNMLLGIGFKEIEVSFPSASADDHDFVRMLIDRNLIPDDVRISVLTQARRHLIDKTIESLRGVRSAIAHCYVPTSDLHGRFVFNCDHKQVMQMAIDGTRMVREAIEREGLTGKVTYEFSPEEFTDSDLDFVVELCCAVKEEWGAATPESFILNLPATVERRPPNQYADMIELFCRKYPYLAETTVSLHAHNDQGCAVAATELALLAGATRVEGTIFGHGERTGNLDISVLALNLESRGVKTGLNFSNMPEICDTYERMTRMHIYERTPYAGQLVFAAFSGSHQDAIAKGMAYRKERGEHRWTCPYIPIDPHDIGRTYDADVIRINSQSGKGGIGFVLEQNYGYNLPPKMREALGYKVKSVSDHSHKELSAGEVLHIFEENYLNRVKPLSVVEAHFAQVNGITATVTLDLNGQRKVITSVGNGRLDAVANAIQSATGMDFHLETYSEHSLDEGSTSRAASYVGLMWGDNTVTWGAGTDTDIIVAGIKALVSAINSK